MENNKLKIASAYLINSGIYLSTIKEDELNENIQIKDNIINFLMHTYLYLTSVEEEKYVETKPNNEKYLTRKEVIAVYHPLLTEYGLTQAINKKELKVIKRGRKSFFNKKEIDGWIEEKEDKSLLKSFKLV